MQLLTCTVHLCTHICCTNKFEGNKKRNKIFQFLPNNKVTLPIYKFTTHSLYVDTAHVPSITPIYIAILQSMMMMVCRSRPIQVYFVFLVWLMSAREWEILHHFELLETLPWRSMLKIVEECVAVYCVSFVFFFSPNSTRDKLTFIQFLAQIDNNKCFSFSLQALWRKSWKFTKVHSVSGAAEK